MGVQMKVMTMHTNSPGNVYGGAYRRYMELINGFLAEKWYVHHISPKGFNTIQHKNLIHHDIFDTNIGSNYVSFLILGSIKAVSVGKKIDIDMIVLFSFFDAMVAIIFRLFNPNTKIVYCDRGDSVKGILIDLNEKYHNKFLNNLGKSLLNFYERFIYQRLDLIIFNSNVRKKEIYDKMEIDSDKTITIYNNANPSWVVEKINEAKIESQELRNKWKDKRILCFVGNLFIDGRDLGTLLQSYKIVQNEVPNSILIMVGEGPDKQKIIEIRDSLGLEGCVFIEGWKDNPFSYMLASDINIVTGLHEGCSNTILESIFFETVMIGSDVGGISKLLQYEELLFPPKDIPAMSKKIINLLNNENDLSEALTLIKKRKENFVFDWNKEMIRAISSI